MTPPPPTTPSPISSCAIANVMVLAENYPQLRADQSFLNLQKELTETENRIADAGIPTIKRSTFT